MKKLLLSLLAAGILSTLANAQSVKEKRDVKDFNKISYSIPGTLNIRFGQEFSLTLEGDKKYLDKVETIVADGRLKIRCTDWGFSFNERVTASLTLPSLNELSVAGSGKAQILDALKNQDLIDFSVSGSGSIVTAEVTAGKLDCSISGSGNISIASGNAESGDLSISGSGNYSGVGFEVKSFEVSVSGSGNANLKAAESLRARISGSGNITYSGDPKVDAKVSGSGRVRTN